MGELEHSREKCPLQATPTWYLSPMEVGTGHVRLARIPDALFHSALMSL